MYYCTITQSILINKSNVARNSTPTPNFVSRDNLNYITGNTVAI